jgi:predicted HD phosphohydrolase
VPVRAGDTLWFHSRTPHRSGPNRSPRPRRALYPTYNALSEGDRRADYYRRKAAELAATADGDRVPVVPHEVTGPTYLATLFPASVTDPIALHVAAKRYLCAVDPGYHARLSAGSVRSLRRQGGPMSAGEAAAFADRPGRSGAVALRRWDDAGKVDGLAVPRLDEFAPLLHALARPAPGG